MMRLTIPSIDDQEINAVKEILVSGYLTQGQCIKNFEDSLQSYLRCRHAIVVSSGTAALHLALLALDIGKGDEVIIPDYTFPATANMILAVGAIPVVVDIDIDTFNIDVSLVEASITGRTKAMIPVHLFGCAANMKPIMEIARHYHLKVIEDAACALGSTYEGVNCGVIGDIGCFSFHPRKIITTGEGGCVVTNSDKIAQKVRLLRNHGMDMDASLLSNRFKMTGFNYRMTDFQGAMGLVQLEKIEHIIRRRVHLARRYNQAFKNESQGKSPVESVGGRHTYQSYVMLMKTNKTRDHLMTVLSKKKIESAIGTYALSLQQGFSWNLKKVGSIRRSHEAFHRSLTLPLYPSMKESHQDKVIDCVKKVLNNEKSR